MDSRSGAYYEVDLNLLIKEVIADPFAPGWFPALVKAVAKRYQLEAPIVLSSLAASPNF